MSTEVNAFHAVPGSPSAISRNPTVLTVMMVW